jgi:ankyrin repeat protein
VVSILLDAGADVETTNNEGFTPLVLVSQFGHVDVLMLFIQGFDSSSTFYLHISNFQTSTLKSPNLIFIFQIVNFNLQTFNLQPSTFNLYFNV